MRELVLTPEAFDDLHSAYRWYEEKRPGLGADFERVVEATLTRIQRMPAGSPEVAPPFRRAVVRRYPYDIYYTFDEQQVLVVLIFHTARDPAASLARLRTP